MKSYTARIALEGGGSTTVLIDADNMDEAEVIAKDKHGRENVVSVEYFDVETPSGFF